MTGSRQGLILMLTALAIGVGVTAMVWALGSTGDKVDTNSEAIHRADKAAQDAKRAITQIQKSRLENCRNGNERHDKTIAELDRQIAELSGARRAEAKARRDGTVALLEAIVPRQDCEALVQPPAVP